MADINEHVAYLSQEIGPRPAGTEEEQRAALYISEKISSATGLPTAMEDFQCNPDSTLPRALCSGVAVIVTLVATIFSVVTIPAAVIALLCAALMAAEIFGKPVLSRFLNRGVSQNVVTKYVPLKSANRSSRRRKVILVANYDSGKVRRDLNSATITALPVLHWVEFAMLVLMPVLLVVRMVMVPQDTALVVFNVLLGVSMVIAALPVIGFVVERFSAYNEGANCNASGVAVLMEVAFRVAASRDLPDAEDTFIHGEDAARSAGLVPEGAELVYDVAPDDDLDGSLESASQRLAAAKAAVAALSGKPVSASVNISEPSEGEAAVAPDDKLPQTLADGGEGVGGQREIAAPADADVVENVPAPVPSAPAPKVSTVPDWFKKAQEQAKKPAVEKPIQRSRYADALATAEEEIAAREQSQRAAAEELSARMRNMRDSVQAASEAAGAMPTGIIPDAAVQAASQSAAMEAVSVPRVESTSSEQALSAVDSAQAPAPSTAMPPAQSLVVPPSPSSASEQVVPVPATPGPSSAAVAVSPVAIPEIAVPTDDPNVSLREGQRPLTGSTSAHSPLGAIPNPLDGQSSAAGGRRLVVPEVETAEATAVETAGAPSSASPTPDRRSAPRKRRAITLPNIGVSQELPRISMDEHQQAAPLAEERPAHDGRVRDLSAVVPTVAVAPSVPQTAAPSAESALRNALPSLAGAPAQVEPGLSGSISLAGSFSSMGATGAAAPIGDELLEEVQAVDELYVDDADDSAYVEQITETGAIAGPGYVEMPKSRFGRVFGKLRRKGKEETTTPQQWLNVGEDFEAQEVGAARGSWESFREDDTCEEMGQTTAFTPEYFDEAFDGEDDLSPARPHRHGRSFEGGAFSRGEEDTFEDNVDGLPHREPTSVFADGLPENFIFEDDPVHDRIEQFHNQRIDVEVWFVALGSELAGNGGMRAFIEAHEAELKGSIIMEVQALGAGELTLIDKEGTYLPKKSSSRMKRLVKKAGQAVGLSVPTGTMNWMDSSSAYALKHGYQALHVAGRDGKKPAFFAQGDDVVENIDADLLSLNADFVMELLKQV